MRSSNITEDTRFIHAAPDVSFRALIIIHEYNYKHSLKTNKDIEQIRNGARW